MAVCNPARQDKCDKTNACRAAASAPGAGEGVGGMPAPGSVAVPAPPPSVTFPDTRTKASRADGAFKDAARRVRCQEVPGGGGSGRSRPEERPPAATQARPAHLPLSSPTCAGRGRGAAARVGAGQPGSSLPSCAGGTGALSGAGAQREGRGRVGASSGLGPPSGSDPGAGPHFAWPPQARGTGAEVAAGEGVRSGRGSRGRGTRPGLWNPGEVSGTGS